MSETREIRRLLRGFKDHRKLDRVERDRLIREAQAGNQKGMSDLMCFYKLLIYKVAKQYEGMGVPLEDLFQEGSDGFTHGVMKFDLSRGLQLSTYVTYWIRQRIYRAVQNTGRLIRIPVNVQADMTGVRRLWRRCIEKNQGKVPSPDEFLNYVEHLVKNNHPEAKRVQKLTPDEIRKFAMDLYPHSSLDEVYGEDDSLPLINTISQEQCYQPEEVVETELDSDHLWKLLDQLNPKDRAFIVCTFGLGDNVERSPESLAEITGGLSPSEIEDKKQKIIARLKLMARKDEFNILEQEILYDVVLEGLGDNPEQVIGGLRNCLDLKLMQVAKLVETLPNTVAHKVPRIRAEKLIIEIKLCGGVVSVVKCV